MIHVLTDTVDPSAAPPSVGAHFINTVTGAQFFAKGTSGVGDWVAGGGGGGAGLDSSDYQHVWHLESTGALAHATILSRDGGRTFSLVPTLLGDVPIPGGVFATSLLTNGGRPSRLTAIADDDGVGSVNIYVSLDGGVTWKYDFGAAGADFWDAFANSGVFLVAGYDAADNGDGEYLLVVPGLVSANDRIFFYTNGAWSARVTATGLDNTLTHFDLQGGLSSKFYLVENAGASFNLLETANGGATWTDFVTGFQGTATITAMVIDPTVGMLVCASGELFFSADGIAAPTKITGADVPVGFTFFAAFSGNGRFVVWANNGNACRVFTTDGTDFREGAVLAFNSALNSPVTGRTVGYPSGIRGWWDGQKFIAVVLSWTGGSEASVATFIQSADGNVWSEAEFMGGHPRASVKSTEQLNMFGVIAQ